MTLDVKSIYKKVFSRGYDSDKGVLSRLNPTENPLQARLIGSDYIVSHNCFLFSCPPLIDYAVANPSLLIRPLGLITRASTSVNKQYIPWNEFGSAHIRHLPGKTSWQISISRLYSNHDSLMFAMYQWLNTLMMKFQNRMDLDEPLFTVSGAGGIQGYSFRENPGFFTAKADYKHEPNSEKAFRSNRSYRHFHNLGSELFDMPTGILCVELDGAYGVVNAEYWENVKIAQKDRSYDENPVVMENMQLLATNVVPATKLWREIKVEFSKLNTVTLPSQADFL